MSDYPRTHALLVELCGLDEVDAQLPLAVIANLHRALLCEPVAGMVPLRATYNALAEHAEMTGQRVQAFRELLAAQADLDWVAILNSSQMDDKLGRVNLAACRDWMRQQTGLVREVLEEPMGGWQAYEALTLLYYVGQRVVAFDEVAPAVELGLSLVPQLHAFALACAQVVPYAPVRLV